MVPVTRTLSLSHLFHFFQRGGLRTDDQEIVVDPTSHRVFFIK